VIRRAFVPLFRASCGKKRLITTKNPSAQEGSIGCSVRCSGERCGLARPRVRLFVR
jgi:hypothetical protein